MLAFAASGEGPFGTGTAASLVYRVVNATPNLSDVPAQLRPVIERCLVKDPAARPTAGELLASFDVGPDYWINQPPGYEMVGLSGPSPSGNSMHGTVQGVNCTTFSVTR